MTMTLETGHCRPLPRRRPLPTAAADYDIVRRAIAHIRGHWRAQPEIDTIARSRRRFRHRFASLVSSLVRADPQAFLQALTLSHARDLLRTSASVLDTSYEVGLSGPGRLHDLFVTHEAMSPGEWKAGGEGLTISYGFHPSPVRHGAGDATRRAASRVSRSPTPARSARRLRDMQLALAEGAITSRISRATGADSRGRIFDPGAVASATSRCAWC